MIQKWVRSGLVLLAFSSVIHGQSPEAIIKSVNSIPGWTATTTNTFIESDLDKFDPKLAVSLRLYGVSAVTVQSWKSPFGPVRATLFQLLDPSAAYGFFTVQRKAERGTSPASSVGIESFQTGNRQYFWQASYVVRLEGESRSMEAVARTLSENIMGRSQRPPVVNHLPSANLIAGSEEYILNAADIHGVEGLNPASLGFDDSAEAATADYRVKGNTVHLLLMLYPTQQVAKKYSDQLNLVAADVAVSQKRIGPLLALVFGTTDQTIIQTILNQVHYESKVTWNEPQPGLGLGPVIVTVFTFIGILLGLCIVIGVSLGGIRILMKARYPDRVFDRSTDMEIIQLKLDQRLTRKELHD